jgi:formylglycine-generating enzyme required for sulfatase activity
MENFKDILPELAKKLTAPLAFAVLIVIVVAALGGSIPPVFQALIYIVVIGGMLIYAAQAVAAELAKRKENAPPAAAGSGNPAPSAQVKDGAATQGNNNTALGSGAAQAHDIGRDMFVINAEKGANINIGSTPPPAAPPSLVSPFSAPPSPLPRSDARDAYLRAVIADCRPLRLAGLDERAGDPNAVRLSLEDVYINLHTTATVEVEEEQAEKSKQKRVTERTPGEKKTRPRPALEALAQVKERRMVLLGFPGTGKSTFVRYVALRMAQELQNIPRQMDWPGPALLPVAVSLGRFAESLPPNARRGDAAMVEKFLLASLQADPRLAAFAPHLLDALRESGGLLLFDGLDEVADLDLRPLVVQALEDFVERYARINPNNRFLVTCRTYSYTDPRWQLTAWPKYELALLNNQQIEQFVAAWYDQHTRLDEGRAVLYAEKRRKLLAALRPDDRRRLYEIAPYPIILTVMAIVHASYELPDSRAQVYDKCVDLLLEKWQTQRSLAGSGVTERRSLLEELEVPRATLDLALREIAFEAHRGREGERKGDGVAQVTETLLTGILNDYLKDLSKVNTFLEYCQSANGLLMLQGTVSGRGAGNAPARRVYVFPHLTFEEYLAARHLGEAGIEEKACDLLRQAFDRWREVFMLLGEHLCFAQPAQGRMEGLFQTLAPNPLPEPMTDADWRAVWLAGDLLTLYRRVFPRPSRSQAHIIASLQRLVQTGALDLRERAAAADTLDALGWLPPDLHTFVSVPVSGITCHVGRYPVTNAQYERFLKAQETDPKWEDYWRDLPIFGCPDEEYKPLKAEDGRKYIQRKPRYWDNPRFGIACCGVPVVGVTWYEANAYCKWLQAHWGELEEGRDNPDLRPALIRLPTEAEWIAAAGGAEPEERCPWDMPGQVTKDEEIIQRANIDSEIKRTTPMGMYPLGISQPYGLWDMAGNTFEWQANFFDKDHNWLALRGGAWDAPLEYVRLSARFNLTPNGSWTRRGFRIVVFPSLF